MIKIVNLQKAILTLSSILMLMALFAPAAHASPCHGYEQDTPQINQVPVKGQGSSGTITAIKSNVIQHNSGSCCMVICNTLCSQNNIPVHSLSISSSFEKKYPADFPTTNHQNDADLEDTQTNLKLQAYYQISHPIASSLLQTTLKHRILLI